MKSAAHSSLLIPTAILSLIRHSYCNTTFIQTSDFKQLLTPTINAKIQFLQNNISVALTIQCNDPIALSL